MDLSIIIVNWNSAKMLYACLDSLKSRLDALTYEVFVVDNCSDPSDVHFCQNTVEPQFSDVKFVYNTENIGFARANNQVLGLCQGRYILFLNPDTLLIQPGFAKLLELFSLEKVGMVGCRLLNDDHSIQLSCFKFPTLSNVFATSLLLHKILPSHRRLVYTIPDHELSQKPDWILGAFMLLPRNVALELKGFAEDIFMYGEDMDLCYRLKCLGLEVVYAADYSIIHLGGCSGKQAWSDAKKETMVYKAIFYFYRKFLGRGKLVLARIFYSLGALIRISALALNGVRPGRGEQVRHEINTQWWVLLTQLGLK